MTYLERRFIREQAIKFRDVRWTPRTIKDRSIQEIVEEVNTYDPVLGEWISLHADSFCQLIIAMGNHQFGTLKTLIGLDG